MSKKKVKKRTPRQKLFELLEFVGIGTFIAGFIYAILIGIVAFVDYGLTVFPVKGLNFVFPGATIAWAYWLIIVFIIAWMCSLVTLADMEESK